MWGMSTSSRPRSKRLCLELSGRKKKAPKHRVMKALRMRRRMNFSESLSVALWCGKEDAPGDRVGILRPDSGRRAGVVMVFDFWSFLYFPPTDGSYFAFRRRTRMKRRRRMSRRRAGEVGFRGREEELGERGQGRVRGGFTSATCGSAAEKSVGPAPLYYLIPAPTSPCSGRGRGPSADERAVCGEMSRIILGGGRERERDERRGQRAAKHK